MGSQPSSSGPDLKLGIPERSLRAEPVLGQVDGEPVLLVRDGQCVHAVAATCTHYGGPLAEGIVVDGHVHCPWHHACFDLATGAPRGPAITPLATWDVQIENGTIRVGKQRTPAEREVKGPERVVIVGGGAAGVACAEALRLAGHHGTITIVSSEGSDPVDRPNLSKDYLAGTAPEEWVYLRTTDALREHGISLVSEPARKIDPDRRVIVVGDRELAWDALLIATGCEPIRLSLDGATLPHVHTLRTLADSRSIAAAADANTRAVVIGASFIGLEVAASLRARGAAVTVVGPESTPLARVLGDEVGAFVKRVHESKGVSFRLGRKPVSITPDRVVLDDGSELPASLVVMGVGVRPRIALAEAAGLPIDRGIVVGEDLRAAPAIWAAGDVARYPWRGERVRIEHWQVAVRHGQQVARAMLGQPASPDVPFFWSEHHGIRLAYVGHAEQFSAAEVHGDLDAHDAHVVYRQDGQIRAVVTVGRDKLALRVEAAMERDARDELEALVR
jgi:NADPH-dependent 2,4-dienoyl-CoA reductase/sulfur reductase-like enzyme/nitrite reductase/ring-hydroxylating ferredoxin subunit